MFADPTPTQPDDGHGPATQAELDDISELAEVAPEAYDAVVAALAELSREAQARQDDGDSLKTAVDEALAYLLHVSAVTLQTTTYMLRATPHTEPAPAGLAELADYHERRGSILCGLAQTPQYLPNLVACYRAGTLPR